MTKTFDLGELQTGIIENDIDMNAKAAGFDQPAARPQAHLVFNGYWETGDILNKKKTGDVVHPVAFFEFRLVTPPSGVIPEAQAKGFSPRALTAEKFEADDGTQQYRLKGHARVVPATKDKEAFVFQENIRIKVKISDFHTSPYQKLFKVMQNGDEAILTPAQCLGMKFLGDISHSFEGDTQDTKVKVKFGDKAKYANLDYDSFKLPFVNGQDGVPVDISAQISDSSADQVLFLWGYVTQAMWDSVHVPSKNKDGKEVSWKRDMIKSSSNYSGSKLQQLLNPIDFGDQTTADLGDIQLQVPDVVLPDVGEVAGTAPEGGTVTVSAPPNEDLINMLNNLPSGA